MPKKTLRKEAKNKLSEDQLALLNQSYPVADEESNRLNLPRFGMLSKDLLEESGTGKNKKITVIESAGTFFTERNEGEVDDKGKAVYTKKYIADETVDVIIVFQRKQLRKYDSSLEKFISSPVYDTNDQVLPLYLDKQIIKRGTPKELQSLYPALTQKGKPTSDLKEDVLLYVLYEGEMYQCNLSQSSKWEFKSYQRKVPNPSLVVTTLSSVEDEFGTNKYRKMTFSATKEVGQDDFDSIIENQGILKEKVESDAKFYLSNASNVSDNEKSDKEFDALVGEASSKM